MSISNILSYSYLFELWYPHRQKAILIQNAAGLFPLPALLRGERIKERGFDLLLRVPYFTNGNSTTSAMPSSA